MINVVIHFSGAASRYSQIAGETRYALDGLPDECKDPDRDAIDRFDWNAVWQTATILHLPETVLHLSLVAAAIVSAVFVLSSAVLA